MPDPATAAEIAEIIARTAAARGHLVGGKACPEPDCAGCRLVRQARETHPQLELPAPRGRSREPGEEG